MITIEALATHLHGKLLVADTTSRPVKDVVASDLMSDVLVVTREDFLLVTSLASDQMIRTADLVGAAGVVLVNGKPPPASALKLATDLNIALITTPLPKYEACLAIGQALAANADGNIPGLDRFKPQNTQSTRKAETSCTNIQIV